MSSVPTRHSPLSNRKKQMAVVGEFENLMTADIAEPHVVAAVQRHAVGDEKKPSAPRIDQPTRARFQLDDRRGQDGLRRRQVESPARPVKNKDVSSRIETDSRDLSELDARRQLRPSFNEAPLSCLCAD